MHIRLAYAMTVLWIFAFSLAPLALLAPSVYAQPTLTHKTYACFSTAKPVKPAAVPHHKTPAKVVPKATYSKAQLAHVTKWTRSTAKSAKVLKAVHEVSATTGLPATLLLAVIKPESSFNPKAKSKRGDYGLMQVRIKHHRKRMERLGITDVFDAKQNVLLGADIIVDYRKSAKGSLRKALIRYTGGSTKLADQILRDMKRIPA